MLCNINIILSISFFLFLKSTLVVQEASWVDLVVVDKGQVDKRMNPNYGDNKI